MFINIVRFKIRRYNKMKKRAKRQKIAQTTQGKTTDYIDPRNPYITRTQDTKKLLRRKSGTASSSPKLMRSFKQISFTLCFYVAVFLRSAFNVPDTLTT